MGGDGGGGSGGGGGWDAGMCEGTGGGEIRGDVGVATTGPPDWSFPACTMSVAGGAWRDDHAERADGKAVAAGGVRRGRGSITDASGVRTMGGWCAVAAGALSSTPKLPGCAGLVAAAGMVARGVVRARLGG